MKNQRTTSAAKAIPSARFTEKDADSLIAHFGVKPAEETRENLQTYLRGQKEQYMAFERERARRINRQHDRKM